MESREISRDRWIKDLDAFSKVHEGWIVELEVVGSDLGDQEESTRLPLVGIAADVKGGENRIGIIVGGRRDAHLTHFIESPKRVWVEQSDDARHDALSVEDADGRTTVVHFRHFDPEQADRLLPGNR